MIIYNVTVNIDEEVHDDWLEWMKTKHIPDVMNTGKFVEYKMCKVLSVQEDETGHTYAIQYFCNNLKDLEEYQAQFAPKLQQEHTEKYKDKFVAFRTLLEVV
ncbi:MAG: DUF4286 family protein [Vicingaceae bacterium]|jgi:hypothetical protein